MNKRHFLPAALAGACFFFIACPSPVSDSPKTFSLTAVSSNTQHGTVSKSPDAARYQAGSAVVLTATPAAGFQFDKWSGDVSDIANPLSVKVERDLEVYASFVPDSRHRLSLTAEGGASPQLVSSPVGPSFEPGAAVTVTAPEVPGYVFDGWAENGAWVGSPQAKDYSFTMDADRSLVARYTQASATFLVYMAADNNLEPDAIADFNEMEAADLRGTGIRLVCLFDRSPGFDTTNGDWTSARTYLVTHDPQADGIIRSPRVDCPPLGITDSNVLEINMGDGNTLRNFASWGKSAYSAPLDMLVFWNHGGGWRKASPYFSADRATAAAPAVQFASGKPAPGGAFGNVKAVCSDDTSQTMLPTKAIGNALSDAQFDVLGFDLCYGGMIEEAYELRNKASFMVASEEVSPGTGWNYTGVLRSFAAAPARDAASLANVIVDEYALSYASVAGTTMAAYRLDRIDPLMTAFNAFCSEVSRSIVDTDSQGVVGRTLFSQVEDFYGVPGDLNIDIWDMADKIGTAGVAATQAAALKTAVEAAVVREWHSLGTTAGRENLDAHGIAVHLIYLDDKATPVGHDYAYFADHATVVTPPPPLVPSFVDAAGNAWVPDTAAQTGLLYNLFYRSFPTPPTP